MEERVLRPREDTQIRIRRTFERSFGAGEMIFDEGDPGEVLFVVQSGEIEISRQDAGGERRTVARLSAGDFFGEMSVVLGEPRTARAVAATPCRLLELDRETFEAMCVERPEIAIRVLQRLATRLIEAERRLACLGVDDRLRPLVRVLVRRAVTDPAQGVRIPSRLRALAEDAGLSMREAHHALQQLLDRKVVRLVDDELVASDLDALSSCLDAPA